MEHHPATWFSSLFHLPAKLEHVFAAILVAVLLIVGSVLANRALKKAKETIIPEGRFSLRNLAELAVESLYNMVEGIMGHHHARQFTPLIGTVFIFIFVSNLLGTVPGFLPPTSNVNTNIAIALVIFALTHYYGIKTHGAGYIKHFMGPILLLAPLMFAIELISHLVRPLSLTIRLYGNIHGDHEVLSIFSNLWHMIGLPQIPEVGIPVIFLLLGIFVSFIQAFVFSLLSMVYISGAMAHEEH